MDMTLITRIGRLFSADVHQVLDCLEDPRAVLKQSVREMEELVEGAEKRRLDLDRAEEELLQLKSEKAKAGAELEKQITLCLQQGSDNLAKAAVRRKLEIGKLSGALGSRLEAMRRERASLEEQLKEQRHLLDQVRSKLELQRHEESRPGREPASAGGALDAASDDEVEIAFLEAKQTWAGLSSGGVK
jgi:phage shock protein A